MGRSQNPMIRDLTDLILNAAEKRLRGESLVEVNMLRRVMMLGDEGNRMLHKQEYDRTNGFEELKKVIREAPRKIGELGKDGTGVIDAEFVDEDGKVHKPKTKRKWKRR